MKATTVLVLLVLQFSLTLSQIRDPPPYDFMFNTPPVEIPSIADSPDNHCHCRLPDYLTGDWTSNGVYGQHRGTFAIDYEKGIFKKTELYDDGSFISDLIYFKEGRAYKSFPDNCLEQTYNEWENYYQFSQCVPTNIVDSAKVGGQDLLTSKRNNHFDSNRVDTTTYKTFGSCTPLSIMMTTDESPRGSFSFDITYSNIQVKDDLSLDFLTKDHQC